MNGWYNSTMDDSMVVNDAAGVAKDLAWSAANKIGPTWDYHTLYIPSSLLKNAAFPGFVRQAYVNKIRLGVAYSATSEVDAVLAYNKAQTDRGARLTHMVTEYEPYQAGQSYTYMDTLLKENAQRIIDSGMKHCIYMGWPKDDYWATLVEHADEINLHCYRTTAQMTDASIYGYVDGRLKMIAAAAAKLGKILKVNIIYSCEPAFAEMKKWLFVTDAYFFVSKYGRQIKP